MNKNEAINNIKETLKRLMKFDTNATLQKFEDLTTKDGTILNIEDGTELAPGVAVFKVDDQGNQTPCEDGTYELEDGRTVVVTAGVVESVSDAVAPEDGAAESPVSDANVQPAAMADAVAAPEVESPAEDAGEPAGEADDLATRVDAIESQIAQILEILQGMSNMNEQTMAKVQEFAASPAEESIKPSRKPVENVYSKLSKTYTTNKTEIDELKALLKKSNNSNYGGFKVGN